MQRITGLPEEQVLAYEVQAEAIMRAALAAVMDRIAARIEASVPVLASALVGADPPAEEPLPPGQPYVSPDDLASIPPLWQEAVQAQLVPIAAEVFFEATGRTYANMVEASSIAGLPSVGSLAAEQYLAQARNTFERVGDDLWGTARTQLVEGFEQGESIPELATRLRQSAGITARRAVLVARTQVNEASNAGSFAVAQASGLQMQKEWIATPDIRTRPTHLAADGQRVPLSEPFIVGGFSAMFPAAPSLPPSERYNCRCAIGYVMPDRAPAQVRREDAQVEQLANLPGTSESIDDLADAQTVRPAAIDDLGEILPKPEAPGPGLMVRPALEAARTTGAVERAFNDEFERITGRRPQFSHFAGSAATAREHAEGLLRGMERFPDADLTAVSSVGVEAATTYAHAIGSRIAFNYEWTRPDRRKKYLDSLQRDVAGWEQGVQEWGVGIFRASSFHPRGTGSPIAVALHEFGHIIDVRTTAQAIRPQLDELLKMRTKQAIRRGRPAPETPIIDQEDLIFREISSYATKNHNELVAEAFADVMMNGGAASTLSREIFDLLEAEYRRRGGVVRAAPLIDEVFPSQAAPRVLSVRSMTVADLRAELTARGVAIPAKARKADLVREVEAARATTQVAAPRALSTQTVAQLRALAKERGIVVPVGARKADLVKALEDAPTSAVAPVRTYSAAVEDLRATSRSPLVGIPERQAEGDTAYVFIETHANGKKLVTKDYTRIEAENPTRLDEASPIALHRADAEELGALVGDAVGLRSPAVIRTGVKSLDEEFIDGLQGGGPFRVGMPDFEDTDDGRLVGLLDMITGNSDRGSGNWILTPDGRIVSIDMGEAFSAETFAGTNEGNFAYHFAFDDRWKRNDMSLADMAIIRRRLDSLQPEFQRLGRADWHAQMMARFSEVEKRAKGTVRRVSDAPTTPVAPAGDGKAALRAAARERNRLIESSQGTARLLAEVDELIANKATKAAIRQRLDPALIAPEQVYAGADPAIVEELRTALDTGDPAKLRSALTRAGTKAKLKPISKAGAKAKYDAETMEGVGGIDIPTGAQVTVVRRGTTLTLPDGTTMQLTRAQVTPIAQAIEAATRAPAAIQARQAQLRIDAARPTLPGKSRRQSGENAYTTQVEHEGGPPTVTKDFSRLGEGPAASKRRADAEELGALVSESTGIRAPAVIRTGPRSVEMEFIEGKPGDEFLQWGQSASDVGLTGTDDGRLLGLADILMGNIDRNAGNFIRMTDGHLAAIDHETAFGPAKLAGAGDRFGADLVGREDFKDAKWPASIDINPADLVVIRERLEALAPEFDRLGRSAWHRQVMARLVEVEKRASASAPIRLPGLAPASMTPREFSTAIKSAAKGEKALDAAPVRRRVEHGRRTEIIWRGTDDAHVREAIESYTGYDFDPVNNALRGITKVGPSGPGARLDQIIEGLDSALDRSRLTAEVELWRGTGPGRSIFGDPDTWGDDLTGFTWRDDAYTSGTVDRDIAVRFLRAGPGQSTVMLHYVVPRGSRVLSLSDPDPYLAQAEGEMLLARGARFRVVRDNGWITIRNPRTGMDITRVRDLDVEVSVPDETPPLPWATN